MPRKSRPVPKRQIPQNKEALRSLMQLNDAVALHHQGRLKEAQDIYKSILRNNPSSFETINLLGLISLQTGNFRVAADLFAKAIKLNPGIADFHSNLAAALKGLNQLVLAVASYDSAIAIKADDAEVWFNRGNVLKELKQLDAALRSYESAVNIDPEYFEAHINLGNVARDLEKFDAALASYGKAIACNPDDADARYNLGSLYYDLGKFESAALSYYESIRIRPDYAEAFANLGNSLQELMKFELAVISYDSAIAINNDYVEAYSNRGKALRELKQMKAALASYDRAIQIDSDFVEARFNRGMLLLLDGDLVAGWRGYEWRWKKLDDGFIDRAFSKPLWRGNISIAGKRILLHCEQGLGDTIQFCRYVRLVADQGATVVLEVPKALLSLFQGLDGLSELIENGTALPDFDFHCPLLSLPLAFNTSLEEIPARQRYLAAQSDRIEEWKMKLGPQTKPRVGLVWSGNPAHKGDSSRSIAMGEFLPFLPEGCEYFSLQKEVSAADAEQLRAFGNIRQFDQQLVDFSETAALCELMDLVISVDTSVAHLSGALGRPTWVLLAHVPDWRWLLDREDSPWYPSARLFRQNKAGNWRAVFEKIAAALQELPTIRDESSGN